MFFFGGAGILLEFFGIFYIFLVVVCLGSWALRSQLSLRALPPGAFFFEYPDLKAETRLSIKQTFSKAQTCKIFRSWRTQGLINRDKNQHVWDLYTHQLFLTNEMTINIYRSSIPLHLSCLQEILMQKKSAASKPGVFQRSTGDNPSHRNAFWRFWRIRFGRLPRLQERIFLERCLGEMSRSLARNALQCLNFSNLDQLYTTAKHGNTLEPFQNVSPNPPHRATSLGKDERQKSPSARISALSCSTSSNFTSQPRGVCLLVLEEMWPNGKHHSITGYKIMKLKEKGSKN